VFLIEQVLNGLVLGGYYLLIALGLSLIFSVGGVVNLARCLLACRAGARMGCRHNARGHIQRTNTGGPMCGMSSGLSSVPRQGCSGWRHIAATGRTSTEATPGTVPSTSGT
jgi:hypothetical protein